VVDPVMHAEGAVHVTTERLVLGATLMALDHVPAGPVVVVVGAAARVVDVAASDALGSLLLLHPAAMKASATTPARDAVMGPTRRT
jgi:hypothetical protein